MKTALLMALVISFSCFSLAKEPEKKAVKSSAPEAEEKAPDRPPFESEEDVDYVAASKENMLGYMRSDAFLGVLIRPYAQGPLREAELYAFPRFKDPVSDHKSCDKIASQVTGAFDKISLKHEATQMFKGAVGDACEVRLMDPDEKAILPDRHLFVVSLRKVNYVIQFKFPAKAQALKSDIEDMRGFIKGLK